MTFNENEHPRGNGGRFTETHHAEAAVTLAPTPGRPELEGYDIPAPLPTQKFLDGSRIPEGASFEEAYEEFFRPLDEHETAHGPWQTTRAITSEDALLELAGIKELKPGNVRGVFLETDEETGEPVIEVPTRNGGLCCTTDCDGTCDPCVQDDMDTIPTFIRSEREDGNVTNVFRIADPAAASRMGADKKTRDALNHRLYARDAITSGKQPPWAILTPARDKEERAQLSTGLSYARSLAARKSGDERYARELLDLVETGSPLRKDTRYAGALIDTAGYGIYGEAVEKHTAEASRLRAASADLAKERKLPLPPAISALAAAEADRLDKAADQEEAKVADSQARLEKSTRSIQLWAKHLLQESAKLNAGVQSAEAEVAMFDWSSSWPGDPAECPPRPAAD